MEKERDYLKAEAENPISYTPQDLEELLPDKHYDNDVSTRNSKAYKFLKWQVDFIERQIFLQV